MIAFFRQLLAAILSISIAAPVVTARCVYDAVDNRASKTVNGVTTAYLVDTQNPTGYGQVLAGGPGFEVAK